MSRISYVDGRYVPHGSAAVHIEDRGYQFADGVYEVWAVLGGKLADAEGHLARLERSLSELRIPQPLGRAALVAIVREVVRRNRIRDGLSYLQVTRGVARRDHAFPAAETRPTLVVSARPLDLNAMERRAAAGVAVITTPETRWTRCDIKSVALLPNVLAKQAAREAGAFEAWYVDADGYVTEGSSTNAWIVDQEGRLRTRDTGANILRGVTRLNLIEVARSAQFAVDERPFTVEEALHAKEAFITAASLFVQPVVQIDGRPVADGRPGPVAARLRELYLSAAHAAAI